MSISNLGKGSARLSVAEYIDLCKAHFLKNWVQYTAPVVAVIILQFFIRIDVNYTDSLPDHVFITIKGWKGNLSRGDYVAFEFPTENPASPFRKGAHLVKIIEGVAGDKVVMNEDRGFEIIRAGEERYTSTLGAHFMGVSKSVSKRGMPLEAGPVGIIPEGSFYVYAPHKDSLDSRYAMVGWIKGGEHVIGRSFPIF